MPVSISAADCRVTACLSAWVQVAENFLNLLYLPEYRCGMTMPPQSRPKLAPRGCPTVRELALNLNRDT